MRITNAQITATMQGSMNRNSVELAKLMQQMATNKRLQLPSDDPIASVRLLRIQRSEASLEQYQTNIGSLSSSLSMQETNLKSISDTLLSARDRLLWAANGANASEDLAAIAGELKIIESSILSFANVRDEEGRYLFSGTLSDQPAISFDEATGYQLGGNDKQRQVVVANGVMVAENVTASAVFGGTVGLLNQMRELVTTLQDPNLDSSDPQVGAAIRTALDTLDSTHGRLLGSVTELGGRQNALTLLNDSNEDVSLVNQKVEGELSRVDYASANIQFNDYLLAVQSTQKTYLKISELSLFNLL
ncbi:flagellar hook-associated protein FlgL [Pseudomonas seleniipraecipitans]|uniref:Flagellar hook-associated protein FlgL n=1 Tax=Phytopseudomonas seleniipraecipitans TaxID=640205 RepID=A0ABY5JB83_9GAMM|nr:flagellar hook-associated protein FlgL [Pseudomonas seleniipraecipitans]UUD64895.1 flagellar hook-associated protein FlgL [Pseudomonas seleniipraecipitans]